MDPHKLSVPDGIAAFRRDRIIFFADASAACAHHKRLLSSTCTFVPLHVDMFNNYLLAVRRNLVEPPATIFGSNVAVETY